MHIRIKKPTFNCAHVVSKRSCLRTNASKWSRLNVNANNLFTYLFTYLLIYLLLLTLTYSYILDCLLTYLLTLIYSYLHT